MSRENVELTYQAYDAFNRRDLGAVLALMDADVEWDPTLVAMEGPYHGHDGLRRWWESLLDTFPDYTTEVLEVRDLGNLTVATLRNNAHSAGRAVAVEERLWGVGEWRDRKVVWYGGYPSEAEALEAVESRE